MIKNDDDNGNIIDGTSDNDILNGNGGDDTLNGLAGDDKLNGGADNDILNGGIGNDTMTGGAGNDVYVVDSAGDKVVETAVGIGDGFRDRVTSDISYSLASLANIEDLTLRGATGFEILNGTGNAAGNALEGNSADNILDGGKGVDTFAGHLGNDTYVLDDAAEADSSHVQEQFEEGVDTVRTAVADIHDAIANVENYVFTGSLAWTFTGNELDNVITGGGKADHLDGGAGNDTLDGGQGVDTLVGDSGDDTYILDNVSDAVIEVVNAGTDRVVAGFNVDLNAGVFVGQEIENVTLVGSAIKATGNELSNILIGNDAANVLDGQGGGDRLVGGKGDDAYYIRENAYAEVIELSGEGIDTIYTVSDVDLRHDFGKQEIENLTAIAGYGDRIFVGNTFNNGLTGAEGNDTLAGGNGNDTLVGNAGDDILEGDAGADILIGGAGNDQYMVYDAGDQVVETVKSTAPGKDDADVVLSDVSFSLAGLANVEDLILRGANHDVGDTDFLNGTGNALVNHLTGNGGDNILDGGAGIDFFDGGGGADTYVIDNVAELGNIAGDFDDIIKSGFLLNEKNGGGFANYIYTGTSSWTIDLSGYANVNHKLTGGSGSDQLTGSNMDDVLDGGSGADKLNGGSGSDTYVVDNAGDTVTDSDGNDDTLIINRSVDLRDGTGINAQFVGVIEHVTLTGTAALNVYGSDDWGNTLVGNGAANILDGRGGDDTMIGGKGNDVYFVDNQYDMIFEAANEGVDTVKTTAPIHLVDFGSVENATVLSGQFTGSLEGNDLDNVLTGAESEDHLLGWDGNDTLIGNDGRDRLLGGSGNDKMTGGKGDDFYEVDSAGDTVIETIANASGGGTDEVESTVSFSLASLANIENLTLMGGGNIDATGNAAANILKGNDDNNVLDGGAGIDTFDGGWGDDTFVIDSKAELGKITDDSGIDTIQTGLLLGSGDVLANIENYTYTGSANWTFDISELGGDLHVLRGGSGSDKLSTGSSADFLDGGAGADTLSGGDGRDIYVVDNIGDKIIDSDTENQLVINRSVDLTSNTGLNAQFFGLIDTVALTGTANLKVTGDSRDNSLYGNDGANIIDGGEGADFMAGGLGNDTYFVDHFGDIALENIGGGIDTVKSGGDVFLPGFDIIGLQSEIENVVAFGATTGVNFVGNDFNNGLTGSEFNDTLDGGAGNDILTGGKGDDIYVVDSAGDKIVESSGGGIDTVQSFTDFSIAGFANVENVSLVDAGTSKFNSNATGNALANTLTGNEGDNVLDGGKGIDTFEGGAGNDTFIIDDHAEIAHITDLGGGDRDTIVSSVLLNSSDVLLDIEGYVYTGSAKWVFDVSGVNATNYTIVGGSGADTLTGGSSSDYLDGGKGNDVLTGGDGDDTYVVDSAGDIVVEAGTTDYDGIIINRSVNLQTDFGGKIEFATLTGSAALDATGNAAQNTLIGNDAANKLSGLGGNDTLTGGKGDDILSGGDFGDRFIYNALSDRGTGKEVITDFVLRDDDVLDLHNLMESLNIPTGDWFGDGILAFTDDGKGNTIVQLDLDGGADSFVTLVTLVGVTLTEQDTRNYEL